jgi:ankyrin repeat protein
MNVVQGQQLTWMGYFLDRGADMDAADDRGFTALHRAAEAGYIAGVKLLLDRGAAPHPEAQGHTPLSLAQQRNQTQVIKLLENR